MTDCKHAWLYWAQPFDDDVDLIRQCRECHKLERVAFEFSEIDAYEPFQKELAKIWAYLEMGDE